MKPIGACLKKERELKALSVHEVSSFTRIPCRILVSLEADRFDNMPGGDVFARGFIRTYASALHVNPDKLVARFDSARPRSKRFTPLASVHFPRNISHIIFGVTTVMLFAILVATFAHARRLPISSAPIELSSVIPCQQLELTRHVPYSCVPLITETPTVSLHS